MPDNRAIVEVGTARFALAALASQGAGITPTPFPVQIVLVDECKLFGTGLIEGAARIVNDLTPKDELSLRREPNRNNDWAVAVYAGAAKIGYLPYDIDEIPARLMDGGKRIGAKVVSVDFRRGQYAVNVEVFLDD